MIMDEYSKSRCPVCLQPITVNEAQTIKQCAYCHFGEHHANIGPRRLVREGIESSHTYEVHERVIYGTRYIFITHRSLYGGHAGIIVRRCYELDGGLNELVMLIGEDMPSRTF